MPTTKTQSDYVEMSGKPGQELKNKTAMIVGLGGVGTHVMNLLSRAGVGLRMVDKERIYEEELPRLAIYTKEDINKFKAKQAKQVLTAYDPDLKVRTFHEELVEGNSFLLDADVIIDCSNDLKTMNLVHKHVKKIPLLQVKYGADEGMIYLRNATLNPVKLQAKLEKIPNIMDEGIFTPSVTLAASIIASEAFKILLKKKHTPGIISFNAWKQKISIKK